MYAVFSIWYIVAVLFVAGIVALAVVYFKMDKKDRQLIQEFVDANSVEEGESKEGESASATQEEKKE